MSFNPVVLEESSNERREDLVEMNSCANGDWNSLKVNLAGSGDNLSDNYSVSYVSDGDLFTNEDFQEDNASPRTPSRRISELSEKVDCLQRRNEIMERDYYYQLAQVSSLEDLIVKKGKEVNTTLQKLSVSNQLVAIHKQRQEEAEEKLSTLTEEHEHVMMRLSHLEKENTKLNESGKNLENQIDTLANKNLHESEKRQDLYGKLKTISDMLVKSEKELEMFKIKEKSDQDTLEKVMVKNANLEQQNTSNLVIIQDLKSELKAGLKKLAELQNEKVASRIQPKDVSDDLSDDDSKAVFGESFTLDSTIPLESSLFAELEDELNPNLKCCDCMWEKSISTPSTKSINTENFETSDVAVNTEYDLEMSQIKKEHFQEETKPGIIDTGLNHSIKTDENQCEFCHLRSKRSSKKWFILGVILLALTFMVGFFTSFIVILNLLLRSPMHFYCLSTVPGFHLSPKFSDHPVPM